MDDYAPRKALVVCNEKEKRVHENIEILPWRIFLEELWDGEVIR